MTKNKALIYLAIIWLLYCVHGFTSHLLDVLPKLGTFSNIDMALGAGTWFWLLLWFVPTAGMAALAFLIEPSQSKAERAKRIVWVVVPCLVIMLLVLPGVYRQKNICLYRSVGISYYGP